mgnify:CR=1 FL=1
MRLGYNTNGLAHHQPLQAIELLAELGYQSIALTVDHGLLSPNEDWRLQLGKMQAALQRFDMRCVIETGARYLLNPRVKHEPTFVSAQAEDRAIRRQFYEHCIILAAELDADCVSLWSGCVHQTAASSMEADDEIWSRLTNELERTLDYAAARDVTIGFEPEPGMFIDTMSKFAQLTKRLPHPALRLTLDVGHLHCLGEVPIADVIRQWGSQIINVHIEDMRTGIHEHLPFGEGEMDFPPIINALSEVGYADGLHVELSRHSHAAPQVAADAMRFLKPLLDAVKHNQAADPARSRKESL